MDWKVIILDFDGVLVESVGIKDKAFRELFASYPEHIEEIMEYHLSHNAVIRYEKFKYITEKILAQEYTKTDEAKLCERFSDLIVQKIIECPGVDGAMEFLDYFYPDIPLYLVSVNPEEELGRILKARRLMRYFRKVYAHPWKKIDAINEILKHEGLSGGDAVFIGDTHEDYMSACEAKVGFIGRDSKKSFKDAPIQIFSNLKLIKDCFLKEEERGTK